ncbi:MAG: hypothetical protein AB7T10_04240 [bacterium]
MKKIFISMIFLASLFFSCYFMGEADEGTIYYYGFDFSIGNLNSNFSKNDIVAIVDYNPSIENSARGMNVYLLLDTLSLRQDIKDYGEESFNFIDRIEPNMQFDSICAPITVGHLYVMRCRDGFVKFRVMSISGPNLYKKEIGVIYEFTDDSVF